MSPDQFSHPVTQEGVIINPKGDYVEVIEEYPNLAPVEDAVLVDLAGSGQVRRTLIPRGNGTDTVCVSPK